jgi:hypothetical protein
MVFAMDDQAPDKDVTSESGSRRSVLEGILAELAEIRGRVRGDIDAVTIVREGREELERRGL